MSAQVIDNLTEQLKTLQTKQKQMELQQEETLTNNMSLAQAVGELRAKLIMYRHLTSKSSDCIQQLVARLRGRTPDDLSSYPGDRAALLDADLVMAEIYRMLHVEHV